jgi:hypothetical protein
VRQGNPGERACPGPHEGDCQRGATAGWERQEDSAQPAKARKRLCPHGRDDRQMPRQRNELVSKRENPRDFFTEGQ